MLKNLIDYYSVGYECTFSEKYKIIVMDCKSIYQTSNWGLDCKTVQYNGKLGIRCKGNAALDHDYGHFEIPVTDDIKNFYNRTKRIAFQKTSF